MTTLVWKRIFARIAGAIHGRPPVRGDERAPISPEMMPLDLSDRGRPSL